jgi:hypothetical protein
MSDSNLTTAATLAAPPSGVTVRLYNPGFGDCLLLAFKAEDDSARYVLIDCGVHHQYTDPAHNFDKRQRMQAVVEDIAAATNKRLHLVVATHEHTDHLTGFDYAREVFDGIEIQDLWLAWTEDPNDPVAQELKIHKKKAATALAAVVTRLQMHDEPLGEALNAVLEFEYTGKTSTPFDYLRSKSLKKLEHSEDYRRPGEVLTLPGMKGVRFYVLGPPREKEYLSIVDKEDQLYPEFRALQDLDDFVVASLMTLASDAPDEETSQLEKLCRPFDPSMGLTADRLTSTPAYGKFFNFFQEHYGFGDDPEEGPEWRRIDNDWLGTAEQLALKLNNRTNNTSLVLAIELTETAPGKVLLFAADAQAGNWLSWQELSKAGEAAGQEKINVDDLLRRTVFYKVGHHASRNATLSEQGLELMTSPDLVAMIPVDEIWAYSRKPAPWKHPAKTLLSKLTTRTRGRIIRSDKIPEGEQPPAKPAAAATAEWQKFMQGLDWDKSPNRLWVQYTVTG